MQHRTLRTLGTVVGLAAGPFALGALAGDWVITPVLLNGDLVPGVGNVVGVTDLALNDVGGFAIAANTDFPSTFANSVVMIDGVVYYREGDPVPGVPDTGLNTFGQFSLDDAGRLSSDLHTWPLSGGFNAEIVHWNGVEIARSGGLAPANYGPGAIWASFGDVRGNSAGQILLSGSIDDPNTVAVYEEIIHLMTLDASGTITLDIPLAAAGDPIVTASGAVETIEAIIDAPHTRALSENGIGMFLVNATGPGEFELSALVNGAPVAQEGGDSGIPGRPWTDLSFAPLDINSTGQWVIQGRIVGDASTATVIVSNGQKVAQAGDPVPGVPGETIFNFSQSAPIYIAEDGQVMWIGMWLESGLRYGLFLDQEPLVIEDETVIDGATVTSIYPFQDGFELAPDGTRILFRATLDDGREGVFQAVLSSAVETLPGCVGNPLTLTSSGAPALGASIDFTVAGSPFAADIPLLFFAAQQIIPGSPCGVPLAGAGELLISIVPYPFELAMAGNPATANVVVPSNPALAGAELFAQGAVIGLDGTLDFLRLSNGLALCLGE